MKEVKNFNNFQEQWKGNMKECSEEERLEMLNKIQEISTVKYNFIDKDKMK